MTDKETSVTKVAAARPIAPTVATGGPERDRGRPPERGRLTVVDRRALKRIGLGFGVLTVAVTLIAAAVVKQHINDQPPLDHAESLAAVASPPTR
jgi:hypothetical protein